MSDTGSQVPASVIVVAVELGQPDAVILQACALATDLRCELVCAHVDLGRYPVQEHPDGTIVSVPFDPDLPELGEGEFDPKLAEHVTAVLARVNVTYTLRALAGDPARALSHLADMVNARLIVVGTHHPGIRRGVRDFFNGSVAVHLAHRQHRPIVVVPLAPVTGDGKLPWE
ncbi:nucleotide-binding universal stress UspA family protein [Cryobacterium sp. CAN_C3]|uniref:universal stress protein n=1 Tax=unclassified Cryobacterium TaxID=2649013 RepID=UPI0018CAE49D|nr:universal stress protein [Cryobacterium sp. CAN_C3]MEC5155617.1 nucleotide-binding universal stress UspA family protein [Cryobacterium sp. CAN_C3]